MSYGKPARIGGRALGALCAALLVLGLAATPASAQQDPDKPPPTESLPDGPVPGGFGSWAELLAAQEELNAAAEQLDAAAQREPGFTGIEAAPELGRVRLYWHGHPPEPIVELVEQLRRRVPVEVLAADHPLAELLDQQAAIAAEPGVSSVAPHVDGSGLTVGYAGSEEQARSLPAIRRATVPVTIEPFDRVEPLGCTGRQDDCSPYWGGAKYVMPGGGGCSTGFTLEFTTFLFPPTSPSYRMLSAGHCASNGNVVRDGGGETMGTVTGDSDAADLLTINPANGFAARVYLGPWNATLSSNKAVKAARNSFVGNWVCTSGAFTGEHCPVQVNAVNVLIWGSVTTIKATHYQGTVAAGKGDSGGPVLVHQWWGGGVYALGTISAGTGPVACPAGSPSSACFKTVYYVGVLTALAHYKPPFGSVKVRIG